MAQLQLDFSFDAPLDPPALTFVRHPRARHYVIRVRGDGSVRVTIPRGGSKREAQAFAEKQRRWIERERQRLDDAQARLRTSAVPGEAPGPSAAATAGMDELRRRAARELPARLLDLASRHGLTVTRVSVRNQRWRWGSCSRGGHICLNWRLVWMPPAVRDYVMIHELMHLKRLDHSPKFWRLVAEVCPDYQAHRRWLKEWR